MKIDIKDSWGIRLFRNNMRVPDFLEESLWHGVVKRYTSKHVHKYTYLCIYLFTCLPVYLFTCLLFSFPLLPHRRAAPSAIRKTCRSGPSRKEWSAAQGRDCRQCSRQ